MGRGDDLPDTLHFAAMRDDEVLGVMTLFPDPSPRGDPDALRIRWMAVRNDLQRGGVGRLLLAEACREVTARGGPTLWANARDTALGFYQRNGFVAVAASYIDPETSLPHTPVELQAGAAPASNS